MKPKNALVSYYNSSYINKIDFKAEGVAAKRATEAYLPTTDSGKLAQLYYVLKNPNSAGSKNNLKESPDLEGAYDTAHAMYHDTFNTFLTKYDLYDVFMIDAEGTIFYSVYKEMDFATNLSRGAYSNSGLAKVFFNKAKSASKEAVVFNDFNPYEPSLNKPAAFIGTPIHKKNGKFIGALVFQMPVDSINKIMAFGGRYEEAGLGESGEVYLVGPDKLMRSDSRFLAEIDDEHVKMLKTTIGVFKIDTSSVDKALSGQKGAELIVDYRDVKVLSSYEPLNFFGTNWAIVAEIDNAEAKNITRDIIMMTIIIAVVITIAMIVMTTAFLKASLIGKLRDITDFILKIVGGYENSNQRIDLTYLDQLGVSRDKVCRANDEICKLISSFYIFVEAANNVIATTVANSESVASATSELSATSSELSATFAEQVGQVGNVASAMEEMTVSSQEVLSRVQSALEKSNHSSGMAVKGKSRLEDVNNRIQSIKESTGKLAETIVSLNTSSKEIGNILSAINDIADQTNLLALNAAIEAARAGEAGRGFAVVADEVRKLAERTQTATHEIEQIIRTLLNETTTANENMSQTEAIVDDGVNVISETTVIFDEIASSVEDVGVSNNFIEQAVHEQNKALSEINESVQRISTGIDESAVAVDEVAKTVSDIEMQADELRTTIDRFKV